MYRILDHDGNVGNGWGEWHKQQGQLYETSLTTGTDAGSRTRLRPRLTPNFKLCLRPILPPIARKPFGILSRSNHVANRVGTRSFNVPVRQLYVYYTLNAIHTTCTMYTIYCIYYVTCYYLYYFIRYYILYYAMYTGECEKKYHHEI